MARKKAFLSTSQRKSVKRAQDRLRRSNSFVKKLAESQGIDISLRGKSEREQLLAFNEAQYINSSPEFTRRGFKKWQKTLADDLRTSTKEVDYILSQIDTEKMEFVKNSKLRYGSNPQLDYAFDSAVELKDAFTNALSSIIDLAVDATELLEEIF